MPRPRVRIGTDRPLLNSELQQAAMTKPHRLARRAQAILLLAKGQKVEDIAAQVGVSERTVRRYVTRYNGGLMEALYFESPQRRRGRPRKKVEEASIWRALSARPAWGNRWTIEALRQRLREREDCEVHPRTLGRQLHRMGIDLRAVALPPPTAEEIFEANLRSFFAALEGPRIENDKRAVAGAAALR